MYLKKSIKDIIEIYYNLLTARYLRVTKTLNLI